MSFYVKSYCVHAYIIFFYVDWIKRGINGIIENKGFKIINE